MIIRDTIGLALRNLSQAKLRTALTMLGVAIGIASLAGMVSLGVGLQEQFVGRLTQSGVFDSITVAPPRPPSLGRGAFARGGRGGGGRSGRMSGAGGRGEARPAPTARVAPPANTASPAESPTPVPTPEAPRARLDDEAIAKIAAIEHVKEVYPNIRVPLEIKIGSFQEGTAAVGVPMSAKTEGVFQTFAAGGFFPNDTDNTVLISLDFAKDVNEKEPLSLLNQTVTISYATANSAEGEVDAAAAAAAAQLGFGAAPPVKRVTTEYRIAGIVEREPAPGLGGAGMSFSNVMLPLEKAKAIDVEVMRTQSLLRPTGIAPDPSARRTYQTLTVKVTQAQYTQDVEAKIKAMTYTAFSINDLLEGAKRAFIILDIVLGLIGSIALAVSSLGIVNTMVMSILERTREIGIMKAIGGGDSDIRRIFLVEASTIGIFGGALGVAIGWTVGRIINFGANLYIVSEGGTATNLFSIPLWLAAGAIGFSWLVSLVAGSYPARRAARLDPIQALRHD